MPVEGVELSILIELGHVEAIFRYPVKSMVGEQLEAVNLGWHGLEGDRRLAFRRMDDRNGMPWLTASRLPDLVLFARSAINTARKKTFPHISARRMADSYLPSGSTWLRRSKAGTGTQCR